MIRPVECTRGVENDSFSVVTALMRHAPDIVGRLEPLFQCVNSPGALAFADWVMLYAVVLEFRPKHVVEVARGIGSATCLFLEGAEQLEYSFVSFGLDRQGWSTTRSRVLRLKGPEWLARGSLLNLEFTAADLSMVAPESAQRILFFWDAQNPKLSRFILDLVFPRLKGREAVVMVHDVSDTRGDLITVSGGYHAYGPFRSRYREIGILGRFWERARISVSSPAYDLATFLARSLSDDHLTNWCRLMSALPENLFPLIGAGGHWVYFFLQGGGQLEGSSDRASTRRAQEKADHNDQDADPAMYGDVFV